MVFSSTVFLFIFLPIVVFLYRLLDKQSVNVRNIFLLAVSSVFYYYGEQEKILLMYLVILVNYLTGRFVYSGLVEDGTFTEKSSKQKAALLGCVVFCIGLLWYYKYFNFTIEILVAVFGSSVASLTCKDIVLPLGISFYTFHVLSYSFDVYAGRMEAEHNLLDFAAYVLMFPQLVAGPIVRYKDICYQFKDRVVTGAGFVNGIRRFCFGLAKKVLIANTVAVYVDKVFAQDVAVLSSLDCWVGALAYTIQIYFDFSGYSDMAIGLAMMFGFHYKENFNYPYISKTASEFWRRWHISLSTWLRDYVYIYMGGKKVSTLKRCRNVLVVFLLSGLWHGANVTFVCWGLLYGICIVLENMAIGDFMKKSKVAGHIYMVLVFVSGWVIFRADTMAYAKDFLMKMYSFSGITHTTMMVEKNIIFGIVLGCILSVDWRPVYKKLVIVLAKDTAKFHAVFLAQKFCSYCVALVLFVLSVSSIIGSSHNPFIYFRF